MGSGADDLPREERNSSVQAVVLAHLRDEGGLFDNSFVLKAEMSCDDQRL